ncbi:uncharacterized protein FIBRA_07132 [Fibroporia radiculosa]|uniref:BTB domain-containing protein n=1 Tax=Fibroporia radiculosa TaxID=599839 RepID=J4GUE4_9APHY|nr:uncharacterized protein FIBRA_07132 [Fibroporia radiculosa]CCM04935.1 predicted protein [Fibroporia radiculosa]
MASTPVNASAVPLELRKSRSTSPVRKRARVGASDDELDEVIKELQPFNDGDLARDDTYYFSDGSCVLRVENVLFNVHRTMISRGSPVFAAMFKLPASSDNPLGVEGTSDDNPVHLTGDTVTEFRNFLWAHYALFPEAMDIADLTKLMDIARVSNKYSFRSLEIWALDAINNHVDCTPSPLFSSDPYEFSAVHSNVSITPSGQQVTRLVTLAQTCGDERLLDTLTALLRQRMYASIQYAYLAMSLADQLNLRELRGAAYMEVLQKGAIFPALTTGGPTDNEDREEEGDDALDESRLLVSREQQLRLLSGFYRLSSIWEQLRKRPLKFDHTPSCSATWHQNGCTQSWLDFWKEKTRCEVVLQLGLADVPGRLKAVGKEFDRWGTATYMHHDCRVIARKKIQDKVKEIENALPEYFTEQQSA